MTTSKRSPEFGLSLSRLQEYGHGILQLTLQAKNGQDEISRIRGEATSNLFGEDFERYVREGMAVESATSLDLATKADEACRAVEALKIERQQMTLRRKNALLRMSGEALAAELSSIQEEDEALADRIARSQTGADQLAESARVYRSRVLAAAEAAGRRWAEEHARDPRALGDELARAIAPHLAKYLAGVARSAQVRDMSAYSARSIAKGLLPAETAAPAQAQQRARHDDYDRVSLPDVEL